MKRWASLRRNEAQRFTRCLAVEWTGVECRAVEQRRRWLLLHCVLDAPNDLSFVDAQSAGYEYELLHAQIPFGPEQAEQGSLVDAGLRRNFLERHPSPCSLRAELGGESGSVRVDIWSVSHGGHYMARFGHSARGIRTHTQWPIWAIS